MLSTRLNLRPIHLTETFDYLCDFLLEMATGHDKEWSLWPKKLKVAGVATRDRFSITEHWFGWTFRDMFWIVAACSRFSFCIGDATNCIVFARFPDIFLDPFFTIKQWSNVVKRSSIACEAINAWPTIFYRMTLAFRLVSIWSHQSGRITNQKLYQLSGLWKRAERRPNWV